MVKLSTLPDVALLSYEDAHETITASELRERIKNGEESGRISWYTCEERRWFADAKAMIERHIEDQYDQMYEDWDEKAIETLNNKVNEEHIANIQLTLNEMFFSDYVSKYWTLEERVELDSFLKDEEVII
jgi:hypothetical protein